MKLQEYLKSQKEKTQTKEIIVSWNSKNKKNFKRITGGNLGLSEYSNLEKIIIDGRCLNAPLKRLEISSCKLLVELNCPNNELKSLDLSNNHKLEKLDISNNKFSQQSLSFLSHLVNLKELKLGNSNSKIKEKLRDWNCFVGDLEPLKNMNKLELLNIRNTEISGSFKSLENMDKLKIFDFAHTNLAKEETDFFSKKKWKMRGFTFEEIEQWAKIGLGIYDYGLAYYLKKNNYQPSTLNIKEIIKRESWKDIHLDFSYSSRRNWENKNFDKEKTKEWINSGAKSNDYEFVAWLRDIKKETPKWVTNYKEDYQILSNKFKKYGLCSECKQLNTGEKWCKDCNASRLQKKFLNWTKNPQINEFVRKYQLVATDANKLVEWIPYKQFRDVEYLAEGGFSTIYKAKWTKGNISHWDNNKKEWQREKDFYYKDEQNKKGGHINKVKKSRGYREVVLKSLNDSQKITATFLNEISKHKVIDDWFNNIVPCYGLSQDPKGNYIIVMQYIPEGSLRNYLNDKNRKLSLENKFNYLVKISQGLKNIHQKDLVHRDFHSGNILKGIEETSCLITDLGLCKPVNEINQEDQVFGVMPYVAPEVLRNYPYTQAADIYSFGIVTYEILSGLPPYYDVEHNLQLALDICQGQRPKFKIKIPQLLEDLIKRCWATNPNERPTTSELEKNLKKWESDAEFEAQLQKDEEYNKTLPKKIGFPDYRKNLHQGAFYTSRLLPTKEIAEHLYSSKETSEKFYQTKESDELEDCAILTEKILKLQEKEEDAGTKSRSKENWQNIHPNFVEELIQSWTNHNFTFLQVKEYLDIGLKSTDYNFCSWLRDTKHLTPEQVLNHGNLEQLNQEFFNCWQEQQQAQIEQLPK